MGQDEEYIEEVRFKHFKMHDCLDATRAFEPAQLQKDLVRNREIRTKCSKLIRGDKDLTPMFDDAEMDELVRARNAIRSMFGGQKNLANAKPSNNMDVEGARAMMMMPASEVQVSSGKAC